MSALLRRQLKQRRLDIPAKQRVQANWRINQRIQALPEFKRAKRLAAYVACKGEADPLPSLISAYRVGMTCYLPVLHPFLPGRLLFAVWTPDTPMRKNRFNIPEPAYAFSTCIKPSLLDVVLTPLLGFSQSRHRLGMGGGFYDRTFAYRRRRRIWRGPQLIGVAFDEQQCSQWDIKPWDIALDKVVTQSLCLIPSTS